MKPNYESREVHPSFKEAGWLIPIPENSSGHPPNLCPLIAPLAGDNFQVNIFFWTGMEVGVLLKQSESKNCL
jgi:hypothetical protein